MKKDIYIIKNTINDKVYIGQAKNCADRWLKHLSNARRRRDTVIDKEIHKYGEAAFYYQILEYQVENYDEREKYWIKRYNSIVPNGYNVAVGGAGVGAGIESVCADIKDEKILSNIINDLKTTKMSNSKIAKKYHVCEWTIFAINNGKAYCNPDLNYPIRESNRYSKEKLKQLRYALKYELDKTIKDLSKEYKMDCGEVSNINQGITHRIENEVYPLRKGKVFNLTYKVVDDIIALLKTDIPQKDIAKKFNISVNAVSGINTGKNYRRESETYPIRENYQGDSKRNCFSPDEIELIEHDLKHTDMSMRKIAAKYECTLTVIMNINNGVIKKYRSSKKIYPLRNNTSVTTICV